MTFDNGNEFALHEWMTNVLDAITEVSHPYASWRSDLKK
jgi:IS30 family transposase